jgi:lipopolysaccharide export system permease protein
VTTTAAQGFLQRDPERSDRLLLQLVDGSQMRVSRGGAVSVLKFETLTIGRDLALADTVFRPRGRDERELTLGELRHGVRSGEGPVAPVVMNGELHGRLVQAASVAILPLLAVPMGIATKRRRRGAGVVLAAVVLVLYHHVLQVGQGLVELGRVGPAIGSWLPFATLAALACWMLFRMNERPGRGPLDGALGLIDRSLEAVRAYLGRLAGRPT